MRNRNETRNASVTLDLHAYDVSCHEPTRENRKIYAAILDWIETLNPSSVLDVGSGVGILGRSISRLGVGYVGLEPDPAQLEYCRKNYPELNIIEGSRYEPPERYDLREFDLVFSTDVIERIFFPRRLVAFTKPHVRPDGHALTCTPEFGSYWRKTVSTPCSTSGTWFIVRFRTADTSSSFPEDRCAAYLRNRDSSISSGVR